MRLRCDRKELVPSHMTQILSVSDSQDSRALEIANSAPTILEKIKVQDVLSYYSFDIHDLI